MIHKLEIKGGRSNFGISGTCTCGQWSEFVNTTTRRGNVLSLKESIKVKFKSHKVGA